MRAAFSLVELSIVLVILGLLTGGILAGQSLIRAAEMRGVITQVTNYQTSVFSFRDKYFTIPGDMTNAQSFWGVAHATPATCNTTQSTGTQTCNGDGDGFVETSDGGVAVVNEMFRFWQHLANAGLIEGSYTGIAGTGSLQHATTANVPKGKLGNGIFNVRHISVGPNYFAASQNKNVLMYGTTGPTGWPLASIMKAEEVWNIDTKIDDGKPGQGRISTYGDWNANCLTLPTNPASEYALNNTAKDCSFFLNGIDR